MTDPSVETSQEEIEDAFRRFSSSNDVGVLLVSQFIAERIRWLIEGHSRLIPTILEIPTKDNPYDPEKDSVMTRINRILSAER